MPMRGTGTVRPHCGGQPRARLDRRLRPSPPVSSSSAAASSGSMLVGAPVLGSVAALGLVPVTGAIARGADTWTDTGGPPALWA